MTNQTQEITFESHPLSFIQCLEQKLDSAKQDLIINQPNILTSKDVEDIGDNYLEYGWWNNEQKELIISLEKQISEYKSKLSKEQLELYNQFEDLKNESELNSLENQTSEQ